MSNERWSAEERGGRRTRRNVAQEERKRDGESAVHGGPVTVLRNARDIVCDKQEMRQQRFRKLAVGGIIQQRKAQLGIGLPDMRPFFAENRSRFCVRRAVLGLAVVAELALEVTRKDRVDGNGMDVAGFPMMRIRLGMNVEQRECKQPHHCPGTKDRIESDDSAKNGRHAHVLLLKRYHREWNTSRSGLDT